MLVCNYIIATYKKPGGDTFIDAFFSSSGLRKTGTGRFFSLLSAWPPLAWKVVKIIYRSFLLKFSAQKFHHHLSRNKSLISLLCFSLADSSHKPALGYLLSARGLWLAGTEPSSVLAVTPHQRLVFCSKEQEKDQSFMDAVINAVSWPVLDHEIRIFFNITWSSDPLPFTSIFYYTKVR